jgi:hypothetical protein
MALTVTKCHICRTWVLNFRVPNAMLHTNVSVLWPTLNGSYSKDTEKNGVDSSSHPAGNSKKLCVLRTSRNNIKNPGYLLQNCSYNVTAFYMYDTRSL